MKKVKIFVLCLMTLISTSAFALFGGGGGASTAVLLKILAVETASKSEHIKNTLEAIEQTRNLKNQLEYDIRNAVQLGKDVANGNEYAIQELIHKVFNLQETSESIMYDYNDMTSKMKDIFRTQDSMQGMSVEQLENQARTIRRQSQYAVYDAMNNAGFSATLQQDQQNLQRLVASTNTAQGQLQALQAIGNLLGEQNAILLRMGALMETQTKMITVAEGSANSIEDSKEKRKEEISKLDHEILTLKKEYNSLQNMTPYLNDAFNALNNEELWLLPEPNKLTLASTYHKNIVQPKFSKLRAFIQPLINQVFDIVKELINLKTQLIFLKNENTELKNSIDELSYENRELRRDMNKLKKFFGKDTIENALTFKIVKSKRKEIHK